jgi:hypothetical protein
VRGVRAGGVIRGRPSHLCDHLDRSTVYVGAMRNLKCSAALSRVRDCCAATGRSTAVLLAGLLLAVAACKGSTNESEVEKGSTNESEVDKGSTNKSNDKSADTMGTFTCKDIKDDVCIDATDRFDPAVPVVHVTYKTKDLPKLGEVFVIDWIAEDVGEAAPANAVIRTLTREVEDEGPYKNSVVNSSLTKPTAGWPVGKYRVEIKRKGELVTTARFSIG